MRRRRGLVCVGRCVPGLSHPLGPIVDALGALGARLPVPAGPAPGDLLLPASAIDQPGLGVIRSLADLLLQQAATRPVLLALEDLQWAQAGTLHGFEQLVYMLAAGGGHGRIMVVMTHRHVEGDDGAAGTVARLVHEPAFRDLPLDPLSEVEVYELLRRLAPDASDPRLARDVYDTSHGNPLVAIVATDEATATGRRLDRLGRRPSAESPDDVIARRFARLSTAAVGVAQALAVGGGGLALRDLVVVAELADEDVLAGLDELERAGLVHVGGTRAELAYSEIVEMALGAASSRTRWSLHGRMAELVAMRPGDDTDLVELSHHLERAGPAHTHQLDGVAAAAADQAFAAGAWGRGGAPLRDRAGGGAGARGGATGRPGAGGAGGEGRHRLLPGLRRRRLRRGTCAGRRTWPAPRATRPPPPVPTLWLVRRSFTAGTEAIGRSVDVGPVEALLVPGEPGRDPGAGPRVAGGGGVPGQRPAPGARPRRRGIGAGGAGRRGLRAVHRGVRPGPHPARPPGGRGGGGELRRGGRAVSGAGAGRSRPPLAPPGWRRPSWCEATSPRRRRRRPPAATMRSGSANWADHALAHTMSTVVSGVTGRFDDQEDHAELSRISCGRSGTTFPPLVLHPAIAWGRAARGDVDGAHAALAELDAAGGRAARYAAAVDVMADVPGGARSTSTGHEWRAHPEELTAYDAGADAAQLELAIHAGDARPGRRRPPTVRAAAPAGHPRRAGVAGPRVPAGRRGPRLPRPCDRGRRVGCAWPARRRTRPAPGPSRHASTWSRRAGLLLAAGARRARPGRRRADRPGDGGLRRPGHAAVRPAGPAAVRSAAGDRRRPGGGSGPGRCCSQTSSTRPPGTCGSATTTGWCCSPSTTGWRAPRSGGGGAPS